MRFRGRLHVLLRKLPCRNADHCGRIAEQRLPILELDMHGRRMHYSVIFAYNGHRINYYNCHRELRGSNLLIRCDRRYWRLGVVLWGRDIMLCKLRVRGAGGSNRNA
jgi:hypothetical protein